MIINVGDNHRITSDENNIILQERKISKKSESAEEVITWSNVGYYPELESAYRGIVKRGLIKNELPELENVIQYLQVIHRDIKSSIVAIPDVLKLKSKR